MTRQHFKISRASEYFDPSELVKRTGQEQENWTHALFKKLMDNALDITDGVEDPEIEIRITPDQLSVWDNGTGMSTDLIKAILDFDSRVSDKFAYQGPTRGQQGNAFKTFLGKLHTIWAATFRLSPGDCSILSAVKRILPVMLISIIRLMITHAPEPGSLFTVTMRI